MNILLDTNVLIGLEDNRPINGSFSKFSRICRTYNVSLFVSSASIHDIENDKDEFRRNSTLSKIEKYQKLREIPSRFVKELELDLTKGARINHFRDIQMLAAIKANAVDFLVTQDGGLHKRAKRAGLSDRLLFIADALRLLERKYSSNKIQLPFIVSRKAYELDVDLEIFDSLREGYPEFDDWFRDKCQRKQRDCWTIEIDENVVGIAIYKQENSGDTDAISVAKKILKLCTFKMSPNYRGERFGEQLLKQALWYASSNKYDLVYVTAFDDQTVLINLFNTFGFKQTYKNKRGEIVLEKNIASGKLEKPKGMLPLEATIVNYPSFYYGEENKKHIVPIQASYFEKLFPEKNGKLQHDLFDGNLELSKSINSTKIPGNSIRKVYVCRATTGKIKPGDVVVFYKSFVENDEHSQCATTIGVVEGYSEAVNQRELVTMTSKRSVFSDEFLGDMFNENPSPIKVIDFLLIGHFDNVIKLPQLIELGALKAAPQSIGLISDIAFDKIITIGSLTP